MNSKKEEIIKWLKELGRLATSRFVGLLGIGYEEAKELLEELEQENIVIKQEETNSTYWILKK